MGFQSIGNKQRAAIQQRLPGFRQHGFTRRRERRCRQYAGGQMARGRDIHIVFRQNTRCKRCSFPRQAAVDGCRLPHAAEDKRVWRTFRTGKLH